MSTMLRMVELTAGSVRDVATVDALMQAAFEPRYGEAWTAPQCLGVMAQPGVWLTLAQVDGRPAGFALARLVADEAELLLIACDPACRRQGVGGALLRGFVREATERGAAKLFLEMRSGNPAGELYARHGFAPVGLRKAYYRGADRVARDAQTWARDA